MLNPTKLFFSLLSLLLLLLGTFTSTATTRTVTNTNASGTGSLHAAIAACVSGDDIQFSFSSGSAPWVINATFQENITVSNITIKGNTAAGYSGVPLIQLDGANNLNYGFDVLASGFKVIGLSITQYASAGIYVESSNCTVQNCYIGVKPDGITASPVFCGVWALGVSGLNVDGVTFGHNVITTSDYPGVYLQDNGTGCTGAIVKGTYIGTNSTGTSALGTIGYGVYMDFNTSSCVVGGSSAAERNVIANCNNFGIHFGGSGNTVKGNYIGTNAAGTAAIGNLYGVYSEGSNNQLGGTAAGEGNLISGNTQQGIFLDGFSSSANETIQGNYIGTNAAGTSAIANQAGGIYIQGTVGSTTGHVIGGTIAGARNVISGNTGIGIDIVQSNGTTIAGNIIGLNAAGTAKIPNTFQGIYIELNSSANVIGGSTSASQNTISGNGSIGVQIQGNSNTLQFNYIGLNPTGTSGLGNTTVGIQIDAGSGGKLNSILNNVISGNGTDGIALNGSVTATNTITGNTIGLNAAGTAAIGNANNGMTVKSFANTIGGTTAAARNIISGNAKYGIQFISNSASTAKGNYIGLNLAGTSAIGNGTNGIGLSGNNQIIGGTATGAGNVISGNTGYGIEIISGAHTIQGNYIGLNAAGTAAVANTSDGIKISSSTANTIGGTAAGASNIISGNTGNGINITSNSHSVYGNIIGLNPAGTTVIANSINGISITGNSNLIGSGSSGTANIISGNTSAGVSISATGGSNKVQGNYIGTDINGTASKPNGTGVNTSSTGTGNFIGTDGNGSNDATELNVISGNGGDGISMTGNSATVAGNYIGVDKTGATALANTSNGISITSAASANTIGGTTAVQRNIISGNSSASGILISSTNGNTVTGNYIGLNAAGTAAIPNAQGITLTGKNNTIGGTASGAGNIISGNSGGGIYIQTSAATGNVMAGNFIGTNPAGTADMGNTYDGILIDDADNNTIGGTTTTARNIISGNDASGVFISNTSTGNTVNGNYIGTDVTGSASLPNSSKGIILASNTNTIGGTLGNLISGNNNVGLYVSGSSNTIKGNWMGINAAGTAALTNNNLQNIVFTGTATSNTVGGSLAADRNIISGAGSSAGITISSGAQFIYNNYIGTNATGTGSIPNNSGISVSSSSNTIGAASMPNVISGNTSHGISINTSANSNSIIANYIGVNAAGTSALANTGSGIFLNNSSSNTIGSSTTGEGNIISGNTFNGITVIGGSANFISGNSIYDNGSLGIDLGNNGVTSNDAGDADAGSNNLQNYPVVTLVNSGGSNTIVKGTLNSTASTVFNLHFYENTITDPSGYGEGKTYLGSQSATTDAGGNASFTFTVAGSRHKVSVTATDPLNNTSEFSLVTVAPEISVYYTTVNIANNSVTPTGKDSTSVGYPVSRIFKIKNTGNEFLSLSGLTLPAGFSVVGSLPATINPADSAYLEIQLDALANGTYSGMLSFANDDADENPFTFAIAGWVGCVTIPAPAVSVANNCDASVLTASGYTGSLIWDNGATTTSITVTDAAMYKVRQVVKGCSSANNSGISAPLATPTADAPADVTACDSYTLPSLTVGNYFTGTGGTGTALSAGNAITSSQTIYVYAETGTTPNCTDEKSFVVTINTTPIADTPADVTACDSYTLPALTVGNYFTGSGGTGTALSAGNVITSSQTIYVYAETGTTPNCTDEKSFVVTINTTPIADAPADVTACDSYTLPALTVGNYFTGSGGTGTALSAGNVITSSQTIYVYAETGTTPNCTDEKSFVVTINTTPIADAPADVTACDSYTLPALTVGNYFTGSGGTGTALSAGNVITSSQTIYVYAETGTTPNCSDENSFVVTINTTPIADAPTDVTACDSYTLPSLTVGNYFTGTGGTGTALSAGNAITSSQTIYVYAETGTTPNCSDENSFVVTINTTPIADAPTDVTACDSYTLPSLTVGNYFTGTGGTGTALSAGNAITSSQTIYVYAETGTTPNCTDENSFAVTIGNLDLSVTQSGATLTANESGATYQWIDCNNGNTPLGVTSQTYTVTTNGNYAVIITAGPCTDTSACYNVSSVGIIESINNHLNVYPNPNKGTFMVTLGGVSKEEGVYSIINELGQVIQSVLLNDANKYTMNIENLNQGVYFIVGFNNNQTTHQKIVVTK